MKGMIVKVTAVVVVGILVVAVLHAVAQPGVGPDDQGGIMGPGGPGMGPMGPPGGPTPVVLVSDGVVYVACDGKLMAFEARTLRKLSEATYWERPAPPGQQEQ
jgi:hypothetical protein